MPHLSGLVSCFEKNPNDQEIVCYIDHFAMWYYAQDSFSPEIYPPLKKAVSQERKSYQIKAPDVCWTSKDSVQDFLANN